MAEINLFCHHQLRATFDTLPPGADGTPRRLYHCPNPNEQRCDFFSVELVPNQLHQPPPPQHQQNHFHQQHHQPVQPQHPPPPQHADTGAPANLPQCKCSQDTVQRTVKKQGPNQNRPFFTCANERGKQCGFFEWADKHAPSNASTSTNQYPNQQQQHQQQPPAKQPVVSATGFVWPTTVRPTANSSGAAAANDTGMNNGNGQVQQQNKNKSFNPQFGNVNNKKTSNLKLSIKLSPDISHVTFPVRATAPQPLKDAIAAFEQATMEKNKGGYFGETHAKLPIHTLFEFEKFVRARAPGAELDFDTVPRPIVVNICAYQAEQKRREATGDVVTRSLDELLPAKLSSALMEFQWSGVHFALRRGGRCLVGDDMGLGKTIQALAVARVYMSDWPLLIVCPSSLRLNWREEALKWLNDEDDECVSERDIMVFMNGKDIEKCRSRLRKVNIVSYDLVRKLAARTALVQQAQFIVCDESHYLKSVQAQRTKAVVPLVKNARRCLLLSGTPALSRPVELFTQVNAISPQLFPSYNDYVLRYCAARQSVFGFDVSGASHLDELHAVLTNSILIRRKKEDVLQQLPEKTRQVMWVEAKPSVLKVMAKKFVDLEDAKAQLNAAQSPEESVQFSTRMKGVQNELYALTSQAKTPAVLDFCSDTAASGSKFIIFAHHTAMLDAIAQHVERKLKLGYIRIDGGTPQGDRQNLCKQFQNPAPSSKCRVAILSITAASVGLTLTQATVVIFAELYWNPGTLLQAEDRAHRIGQRNAILVNYLLAKSTLDESIWKGVRRKLTVVGQSLTGTAGKMDAVEGMSGEDIISAMTSSSKSAESRRSELTESTGEQPEQDGTSKKNSKKAKPGTKGKDIRSFFGDDAKAMKKKRSNTININDDDNNDDDELDEIQVVREYTVDDDVHATPADQDFETQPAPSPPSGAAEKKRKRSEHANEGIDLEAMFPPVDSDLGGESSAAPIADSGNVLDPDQKFARRMRKKFQI